MSLKNRKRQKLQNLDEIKVIFCTKCHLIKDKIALNVIEFALNVIRIIQNVIKFALNVISTGLKTLWL